MNLFHQLWDAACKKRAVFVDGGIAVFNLRKSDNVLVFYTLVVAPERHKQGVGRRLLEEALAMHPGVSALEAKCPSDLDANGWFRRLGFSVFRTEKSSRPGNPDVNVWRKQL